MSGQIIVSRHRAAIEFVAEKLAEALGFGTTFAIADGEVVLTPLDEDKITRIVPIVTAATPEDVAGKVVYGNLPYHLAALAASVVVVEFSGQPPRGQEYDLAAMKAAGAELRQYKVLTRQKVKEIQRNDDEAGYPPAPHSEFNI